MSPTFNLHMPKPPDKAVDFLRFVPEQPVIKTSIMSSTIGSGKTTVAFLRFISAVWRSCTWTPEYGRDNPLALITSPTKANLDENIVPLFRRFIPDALILEERVSPRHHFVLANGAKIILASGKGLIDSVSCRVLWLDEVSHPAYRPQDKWDVINGRCRDRKGNGPREIIYSGIAEPDELLVKRCRTDVDRCLLLGLNDNPGIDSAYRDMVLSSVPADSVDEALNGGWRKSVQGNAFEGLLNLSLGEDSNATEDYKVEGARVLVSIDPGNQCAILVLRDIEVPEYRHGRPTGNKTPGLVAIDEMIIDDANTYQAVLAAHDMPYEVGDICLDTASTEDTKFAVKQAYTELGKPYREPLQLPRGRAAWLRKTKFDRFRWAIKDAHGTRRLLVHTDLIHSSNKRGIAASLRYSATTPAGDDFVKDNAIDHIREACAQVIVAKFRPERPKRKRGTIQTLGAA